MIYLLIKALHAIAVITWTGSTLFVTGLLARMAAEEGPQRARWATTVREVSGRFDGPAMGLTWVLGIALVVLGGWYTSPWMIAKFLFVVALSALHGMLSGQVKKLAEVPDHQVPAWMRWLLPVELGMVFIVVLLVILKPF